MKHLVRSLELLSSSVMDRACSPLCVTFHEKFVEMKPVNSTV